MTTLDELMVEIRTLRREVRHCHLFMESMSRGLMAPEFDDRDPKVFFIPKKWTGSAGFKGKKMSQCTPEFLDVYAPALRFIAQIEKKEGKRYNGKLQWQYTYADAARALRWAYRLRTGYVPVAPKVAEAERPRNPFAGERHEGTFDEAGGSAGEDDESFSSGANGGTQDPDDDDAPL